MREFFVDEVVGIPFSMFCKIHLILIMMTVFLFFLIVINQKRIFALKERTKKKIRIIVAIIMFLNMVIYYNGFAYYEIYDVKEHLPLHLCFIAGFTYMFALITGNAKLYKITYFLSFVGPLPAILWPDIRSVDSFIFIQFIISHHFFLLSSFFLYYAYNIQITKKDMWKTFFITNAIFLFMIGFNSVFGTNYIMSKSFPEPFLNVYPFLRSFDYPVLLLELAGFIVMWIAYIPVYFRNKKVG